MNLGDLRSPQLVEQAARTLLAVPLGATEQHGPHLPLSTDTVIAVELCRRLAERVTDVVVAPPVPYGSSGEHAGFAGTLSIGRAMLTGLVVELVRSADDFAGVVLVNGHGGNAEPLRDAVRTLRAEGRNVLAWSPTGRADDTHAGHIETSVLLSLAHPGVDLAAAEPGVTLPLPDIIDDLRRGGLAAVSPNGVLGDPTHANADDGAAVLDRWTDTLVAAVTEWARRD